MNCFTCAGHLYHRRHTHTHTYWFAHVAFIWMPCFFPGRFEKCFKCLHKFMLEAWLCKGIQCMNAKIDFNWPSDVEKTPRRCGNSWNNRNASVTTVTMNVTAHWLNGNRMEFGTNGWLIDWLAMRCSWPQPLNFMSNSARSVTVRLCDAFTMISNVRTL